MTRDRYFDNAATTPLDERVLEAMLPWMTEHWGNANSPHQMGVEARQAVEWAREQVALLIGAEDPSEVTFTSGATEANNWVLSAYPDAAISPFEHSSIWEHDGMKVLGNDGWSLHPPATQVELVSVMLVNNETGAILEPPPTDALLHRDVTQAAGKLPVSLEGVAFASLSAHKFCGPKGVGALYIRSGLDLPPFMHGGEQEWGRRAGTLNVPGIVGMGRAAELAREEQEEHRIHAERLHAVLVEEIEKCSDARLNTHTSNSPYIASVSFLNLEGETLVVELDGQGFAVSSGAACSTGSTEPSHVLTALDIPSEWLRGTVRISFSPYNTVEAVHQLGQALRTSAESLRSLMP